MTNLPELRKILSDAPDGATHFDEVEFEHFYYKSNGYGFLDCEHDAPVCSDDIIRIRSLADIRTIIEQAEESEKLRAKVAELEQQLVIAEKVVLSYDMSKKKRVIRDLEQQAKGIEWVLDCRELNLSDGEFYTIKDKHNNLLEQAAKLKEQG